MILSDTEKMCVFHTCSISPRFKHIYLIQFREYIHIDFFKLQDLKCNQFLIRIPIQLLHAFVKHPPFTPIIITGISSFSVRVSFVFASWGRIRIQIKTEIWRRASEPQRIFVISQSLYGPKLTSGQEHSKIRFSIST